MHHRRHYIPPPLTGDGHADGIFENSVRIFFLMPNTRVYIDGFNFYYGALKHTCFKWLNPLALVRKMYPHKSIVGIKFFTAPVKFRPDNPTQCDDQRVYWRALRTVPALEIIEGKFYSSRVKMPRVPSGNLVEVEKSEEKGSDVNIASHLLMDGFQGKYSTAILFPEIRIWLRLCEWFAMCSGSKLS